MVVLEQNHVEKSHPVVASTTQVYGHLVQNAHAGCGFSGVDHFGLQALELLDVDGSLGGDTTHALHDVEQNPFGLQQRDQAPLDIKGNVARTDM